MTRNRPIVVVFISTILFLLVITVAPVFVDSNPLHAQEVPAAETPVTPTGVPTQPPPTETPTGVPTLPTPTDTPPPTNTPLPTDTLAPPQTFTPTPTPVPPSQIPEPITVILFGTGLAALSAYAARRKKQE